MKNCFPACIFSIIQATLKSNGKLVFALQFLQGIMTSPVVGRMKEPTQFSRVPTIIKSTYSFLDYLQLLIASSVFESTSSCPKYLQLSRVPPVVESTSSCPKYLQLSRVPSAVESTSSCPKCLQLSRVIFVRLGASYSALDIIHSLIEWKFECDCSSQPPLQFAYAPYQLTKRFCSNIS